MTDVPLRALDLRRTMRAAMEDDAIRRDRMAILAENDWPCVNLLPDYPDIRERLEMLLVTEGLARAHAGYDRVTVVMAIPHYPEATKQRERLKELLCLDLDRPLELDFFSGRKNDCRIDGIDGPALQATLRW